MNVVQNIFKTMTFKQAGIFPYLNCGLIENDASKYVFAIVKTRLYVKIGKGYEMANQAFLTQFVSAWSFRFYVKIKINELV